MTCLIPKEDYKYNQFVNLLYPKDSNHKKHGVALFGLGRAGTIHLNNLVQNSRVNLLYVVEEREERRKEVQDQLGLVDTKFVGTDKIDNVLDDTSVEFVVIATPTQSHQALVVEALNKGKGVFCEKPIANDIKEVQNCYETAAKLGLPLLSAFNRRFDPTFENVHDRVKNGELGSIHILKTCSRDSPLPSIDYLKISNGIFHDCAVHDIDLICWVLNEFPSKVYAAGMAHRSEIAAIDDHDTVVIHLTFPSGAMGIIDLSRFATYGYDQRLEVFGTGGMLSCGNQPSLAVETFTASGVGQPPIWYSFASRYADAYKRELDHFLNALEGKEDIKIKAAETINVCRVALACEESVKTGIPVLIPR